MAIIRVSPRAGLLDQPQREALAEQLPVELTRIETGGADTAGFRVITAPIPDEVPAAWAVGGRFDTGPSAIVETRIPTGALNPERRNAVIGGSYDVPPWVSPALSQSDGVRRVGTHLVEIEDWGAGGRIVLLRDVVQIASAPTATLAEAN